MPCNQNERKTMKNKPQNQWIRNLTAIIWLSLMAIPAQAVTVISGGHTDVFEVDYEQVGTNTPTLHLGVHTDEAHYEPADVLLEVGNAAYGSTAAFSSTITSLLGENAWILPADLEQADALGLLEAGVAKAGFPNSSAVTFTLVSVGASNPGNFVLFSLANSIRLSASGQAVGTASFELTAPHVHYNWGFSAAGTYTFDLKASYMDANFGSLESPTETYTFNVIPEPSSGAMLLAGMAALAAVRRKIRRTVQV